MFDWLKTVFFGSLGPAITFFGAVFNPLIGVVLVIWTILQSVADLLLKQGIRYENLYGYYMTVQNYVGNAIFGALPAPIQQPIGFANCFLPITEALILLGFSCALYIAAVLFRMAKACIPLMN